MTAEKKKRNTKLRRERELRGWSQKRLGFELNISTEMISRWENGWKVPSPYYQSKLCDIFGKNAEELGFLQDYQEKSSVLSKERISAASAEHTLTTFDSTTFSLPSLSLQTSADALTHIATLLSKPAILDKKEVAYFDQQTRLYWQVREETALPAVQLQSYVLRHVNDLTLLLARCHGTLLRSHVCEIVCRTLLLAGILFYDMGHYTKARQHYTIAFQAASEANNFALQAIVWGWMSFTWTYTKHHKQALRYLHSAQALTEHTPHITVQAWLGAIESEIQAHVHNQDACLQALNKMERGTEVSVDQDIAYLFEFNPTLLLGYKGVCLQQFYERQKPTTHILLQEAKKALEQALVQEAPLKRKLYYLSDLAGVHARQGEVEAACFSLTQCMELMMTGGSSTKTIQTHVKQAHALLQPYANVPVVQALDKQLAPLLIGMQTRER